MIAFNNEIEFTLENQEYLINWISQSIEKEQFKLGEVNYIFCSDEQLLKKNIEFLNHDTLTDIISFDYTMGKLISGDIFISIDRVTENANTFKTSFNDELNRVMIHGILHYCGYKDKADADKSLMRSKEDYYLSLRKF
ncbi:MAG: rRNA maturation RNase YbeY [Flavobacteriaceae bacterium]|nr:MAG: rRNA maturation RNase YbeY [Flavobacteriaceae bacterium]